MGEIKLCSACKRRISEREIEDGLVGEKAGRLVCQECGGLRKSPRDEQLVILESILKEVKSISRTVTFEEASIWTVLGALVQCFVFAALVVAYLRGGWGRAEAMLMLAVCFQLMALTFFTLKR